MVRKFAFSLSVRRFLCFARLGLGCLILGGCGSHSAENRGVDAGQEDAPMAPGSDRIDGGVETTDADITGWPDGAGGAAGIESASGTGGAEGTDSGLGSTDSGLESTNSGPHTTESGSEDMDSGEDAATGGADGGSGVQGDAGNMEPVETSRGGSGIIDVSAGETHTCIIEQDGRMVCWGGNRFGQTDAPEGTYTQVSAGSDRTCALRSDGSIACWGYSGVPGVPTGRYAQVCVGKNHGCALGHEGSAVCWGNYSGPLGGIPAFAPEGSYTQLSCGVGHTCALRTDGTIACWGHYDDPVAQEDPPSGSFVWVSAESDHPCAIGPDGTVSCWRPYIGESSPHISVRSGTYTQLSAGRCAIGTDSTITCWGSSAPHGTYTQVSVGEAHFCAIEEGDGAVVCWGANDYGQATVPSGSYTQVGCTGDAVCAVKTDGSVICWGALDVHLQAQRLSASAFGLSGPVLGGDPVG